MPPRNPGRILARLGTYRTATPPQNAVSHERTPANPSALAKNLARASIHKTARDPIIVKDNAVIIADAVRLDGCRAGEHAATKKAPRLISEEPLDRLYEENR